MTLFVKNENLNPNDFAIEPELANLITVALGTGLVRNGTTGVWEVDPAFVTGLTTNILALAGNTLTSTVNGVAATADVVDTITLVAGTTPKTVQAVVNGVASAEFDVSSLADLTITDAFGVPVAKAFSV